MWPLLVFETKRCTLRGGVAYPQPALGWDLNRE